MIPTSKFWILLPKCPYPLQRCCRSMWNIQGCCPPACDAHDGNGVIVGSGYTVDPKKIDFRTCSYIGLFLEKGSMYAEVAEQLRAIREIVECHYITGQYAIFAKIYARDNEHLKSVLSDKIQKFRVSPVPKLLSRLKRPSRGRSPFLNHHQLTVFKFIYSEEKNVF